MAMQGLIRRHLIAAGILAATLGVSPMDEAFSQDAPRPGEAVVTRFSGTAVEGGQTVLDLDGVVAGLFDLTRPGEAPRGAILDAASARLGVTAREVGQVFGIAIEPGPAPRIFLSASAAFGLHLQPGTHDWMPGMWGEGGGPGTIYVLDPASDYRPRVFAEVMLGGRPNSGAGLGNIAYDPLHRQLFASDLETGMIHRFDIDSGADLGRFEHGADGRGAFLDVAAGAGGTLPAIPFDPASTARIEDCPSGDFARTPSCWNFADFRRRVWGLAVHRDPATSQARLFYALWGSQGFGNPDFAAASDAEKRNSVWSVGLAPDGSFVSGDVRREFILPDFFRSPEAIARAGHSNPVSDIAFGGGPAGGVMLLAERGGVRNLGLSAESAFAFPQESRVLRYEFSPEGRWEPVGRYDVGTYDRKDHGPPYLRAGGAGGVSFGPGFTPDGEANPSWPDAFAWFTGDALCSAAAPCVDRASGARTDATVMDGIQGLGELAYGAVEPDGAFSPYPATGPATPLGGPDRSYFVDAGTSGDAPAGNGATRIGDVEIYQPPLGTAVAGGVFPPPAPLGPPPFPPEPGWDPAPPPPDGWFPPPPLLYPTDLAIEKTGPASCQEGVDCLYSVKITNLGAVPYLGILAVNDTMPAGAVLSTASPGWHCVEAAPDVSCRTTGFAILNVGASATLNLAIQLPMPVAGPTVENCAAIDWFEMGTDDGPGDTNDIDCVTTPVDPGFDLGLQKTGPANCVENADCLYTIAVKNWGPGDFNGTLVVKDTLPANVDFVSANAGWSCVQSGAELTCQKGGVTLLSGALTPFVLRVKLPDGIAGTSIENCAAIDWTSMGADDGPADTYADDDCHTTNIQPKAGYFDLGIAKTGPSHCEPGVDCVFSLRVVNHGPDDYAGPLGVRDTMPAGASFVSVSAGWACVALVPNVHCLRLGGPVNMSPGDEEPLTITIQLPNPYAPDFFLNCGYIRFGQVGMPADDNPAPPASEKADGTCTMTLVDTGPDLEVEKQGPEECYEGKVCDYTIRVTNNGPNTYFGVLAVTDTLPAGATVASVSDGWNCHEFAAGTTTCSKNAGSIISGEIETFTLSVLLPDPVPGLDVENCVSMEWVNAVPGGPYPAITGDVDPANDGPSCVTTPVLAADLAPYGGTVCKRGEPCTLDVEIANRGGKLFRGSAGIRGTFLPGVPVGSAEAEAPGLACTTSADGYECLAREIEIPAGGAARLKVVINIPADFPESRITHRKEMIWPDAAVKDRREENDRHVSFIMIETDEPPLTCEGGRAANGECVCPGGVQPVETAPNSFRCEAPPPPPPPSQPTPPDRPAPQCTGGRVQGGACICPSGFERQQVGPNAFRCVAPPPRLVCQGGSVQRGECVCPRGYDRQRTGPNAFRCVAPPPPRLVCEGGRVQRGECICPAGSQRRQTGRNAYVCERIVRPNPQLTCQGGRVANGQCVCPSGTVRRQNGPTSFTCVRPGIQIPGGPILRGPN